MSELADTKEREEIDDLLGFDDKPRRGRPPKRETAERQSNAEKVLEQLTASRRHDEGTEIAPANYEPVYAADVQHGVSIGLLSQIFGMDPTTVKKKLRECAPIHRRKAGFIYDLKAAAQYLVQPVFDAEQYLKTMKPSELPNHLQDTYWSAMTKKQRWEENAGDLWRTNDVMAVFGDVFQTVKFAMQLWPDNVEMATGLTPEQRLMLIGMADELQNEIYLKLKLMPTKKQTSPMLSEAAVNGKAIMLESDDDYSHLV